MRVLWAHWRALKLWEGMAMKVGDHMSVGGYATRLLFLAGQTPNELETRIGYHRGRLAQGFWLLVLAEQVRPADVELVGYSHFSGGKIGHPSQSARPTVESAAADQFGAEFLTHSKMRLASSFAEVGAQRLVKVLPAIRHDAAMANADQYPPGSGIPQFNLTTNKRFLIAIKVAAGAPCPKVPEVPMPTIAAAPLGPAA